MADRFHWEKKTYLRQRPDCVSTSEAQRFVFCKLLYIPIHGLFRQSLNGTGTGNGTGTSIMLIPSHCNGSGTRVGNLRIYLHVLNRDPNVPCGFIYIMPGNDVTLV